MRLLSGNPGMYQHSIQQSTEGESTQQEPEHGEDTIARVKGKTSPVQLRLGVLLGSRKPKILTKTCTRVPFACYENLLKIGNGNSLTYILCALTFRVVAQCDQMQIYKTRNEFP